MEATRAGDTDGGTTATRRRGDTGGALADAHGSTTKKRRTREGGTSLDLALAHGSDTTAEMPIGTGRVVDGVSDGGFGTDDFADEVLSDDAIDLGLHSAWDDSDEVTASSATARKHKRNRRGGGKHKAKDRRKMNAHNAACGMPVVAEDGPSRPDMTQEPGGGV